MPNPEKSGVGRVRQAVIAKTCYITNETGPFDFAQGPKSVFKNALETIV